MTRRLAVSTAMAILAIVGTGATGYVLGKGAAATKEEAVDEQEAAYEAAFQSAMRLSREQGLARGERAGVQEGHKRGQLAGSQDGRTQAEIQAEERRAADAAAAAEAAEAEVTGLPTIPEGLEYTDQLPHGEPGYVLPPEERSLSCVGFDADTGQCVGD